MKRVTRVFPPTLTKIFRKETWLALFVVLAVSAFLSVVFYPGLQNTDSFSRWQMAEIALDKGWDFSGADNWLPPLMPFYLAIFYRMTREIGFFTFAQAFLFLGICVGVLRRLWNPSSNLGAKGVWLLCLGVALLPFNYFFALYISADTWTTILLGAIFLLLTSQTFQKKSPSTRLKWLAVGSLFFLSFHLFALRHNAVIILPALLGTIVYCHRKTPLSLCYIAAILAAFVGSKQMDRLLSVRKVEHLPSILVWEQVGMLQASQDTIQLRLNFDKYFGSKENALRVFNFKTLEPLIFSIENGEVRERLIHNAAEVKRAWFADIIQHPYWYLRAKTEIWKWQLGLPKELTFGFDWMTPWALQVKDNFNYLKVKEWYLNPSLSRVRDFLLFKATHTRIFRSPVPFNMWILLLIFVGTALLQWARLKTFTFAQVTLALLALSYYGGYFIFTAGDDFRFFYPSYILLFFFSVSAFVKTLMSFSKSYRL